MQPSDFGHPKCAYVWGVSRQKKRETACRVIEKVKEKKNLNSLHTCMYKRKLVLEKKP